MPQIPYFPNSLVINERKLQCLCSTGDFLIQHDRDIVVQAELPEGTILRAPRVVHLVPQRQKIYVSAPILIYTPPFQRGFLQECDQCGQRIFQIGRNSVPRWVEFAAKTFQMIDRPREILPRRGYASWLKQQEPSRWHQIALGMMEASDVAAFLEPFAALDEETLLNHLDAYHMEPLSDVPKDWEIQSPLRFIPLPLLKMLAANRSAYDLCTAFRVPFLGYYDHENLFEKYPSLRCLHTRTLEAVAAKTDPLTGALKALQPASISSSKEDSPETGSTPCHLSASQTKCLRVLLGAGRIFFSGRQPDLNTNILLAGETGVGKSRVVRELANRIGARYLRVTLQSYIPAGAKGAMPTYDLIAETVEQNQRVVLHLDEFDKIYAPGEDSPWIRAIKDGVMNILERQFDRSSVELQHLMKKRLFIVGSGTWQALHDHRGVGFGADAPKNVDIAADRVIPPEILRRFHPTIQLLHYPTPEEMREICEQYGLFDLAQELGRQLDLETLEIRGRGMSVLQDLKLQWLLERQEQDGSDLLL